MVSIQAKAMRLGEILLQHQRITPRQLALAIHKQTSNGKRLGEILVDEGLVSGDTILFSLREQHWRQLGLW